MSSYVCVCLYLPTKFWTIAVYCVYTHWPYSCGVGFDYSDTCIVSFQKNMKAKDKSFSFLKNAIFFCHFVGGKLGESGIPHGSAARPHMCEREREYSSSQLVQKPGKGRKEIKVEREPGLGSKPSFFLEGGRSRVVVVVSFFAPFCPNPLFFAPSKQGLFFQGESVFLHRQEIPFKASREGGGGGQFNLLTPPSRPKAVFVCVNYKKGWKRGRCIFLAGRGWRWQEKKERRRGAWKEERKPFELLSCLDGGGGYIIFLRGKLQCARSVV